MAKRAQRKAKEPKEEKEAPKEVAPAQASKEAPEEALKEEHKEEPKAEPFEIAKPVDAGESAKIFEKIVGRKRRSLWTNVLCKHPPRQVKRLGSGLIERSY